MQTKVRKLATMAMLVAISIVLVYLIHFPIFPGAAFLEYDPASGIYRLRHTKSGAILGLICGTIAMGLAMMVANHFITPYFMGAPVEVVDAMLLPVILPFNLLKAGINSLVTFLVYKTVSRHLIHGEGWGHHTHGQKAQTEQ